MVRILLGIITLLAVAAGIFSLKAKSTVQSAKASVEETRQQLTAAKAAQEKASGEAQAATEAAEAAAAAKESLEKEIAAAKAEAEKAKGELASAATQIQEKDTELTDLRAKVLAASSAETSTEPSAELTELEGKLRELQTQLDEQKRIAQNLESRASGAEQRAAALETESARRARGLSAPGLEGKVLAVDPRWNFVVLSIGDRQGVAPNSTLLVKRGTSLVAKVRVSKVERGSSIANIIPGSGPKGASVLPGDVVIYSGAAGGTTSGTPSDS